MNQKLLDSLAADCRRMLVLLGLMAENTPPILPVQPPVIPPAVVATSWDGATNNRHNIRVLCDQSGLTLAQKEIITACIYQESQFLNYLPNGKPVQCINRRADGTISSSDWGIVQVNDRYHVGVGKDFPSVDYVMAHPDKAVQYMINMYKIGKLGLWVSYSSGAYKRWLHKV